jgi:kynurenine formamidase
VISYDELPTTPDGRHHAWDVFKGDERGCLSLLSDDRVRDAAGEIRSGERVVLSVPLGTFSPALSGNRGDLEHTVVRTRSGGDDKIDNFYLQESSQWDGLAHVRYREYGFFGGRDIAQLDAGELGLDHVAPAGIMGRGVLVDIPTDWAASDRGWRPDVRQEITTEDLERALARQGTDVREGDILLVRTGWVGWYLGLDQAERAALAGTMTVAALPAPGLTQGDSCARWLWNHQIAAVAADNPALEAIPVPKGAGFLHRYLIPLLGLPIGELWALDHLSEACARHGRWSFFLASVPVNLRRGVGSPNNAVAIF